MSGVDEVYRELVRLRRGLGLHAPDIVDHVGPRLRSACGIQQDMEPGTARQLLIARVEAGVATLLPEFRLAVKAAYGLAPASQSRFLRDRMTWLGTELQRDPRTATRRAEDGLRLLAEWLVAESPALSGDGGNAYAPDGWYVESSSATLLLHADPVQLLEERRVVVTKDGLDRLAVSWSVPSRPSAPSEHPELHVELIFGGELEQDASLSTPTYWSGLIHLPRPLRPGDRHEYYARITGVGRSQVRPYYVLSPYRRCDQFELRAKFDAAAPPQHVWQLDGVPYRVVDEVEPAGREVELDAAGEIVARFHHLHPGLSYGLHWQDGSSGA